MLQPLNRFRKNWSANYRRFSFCPINHRNRRRLPKMSPWIIRNMEGQRFIKKITCERRWSAKKLA